ncbi:MAG TPA: hypothetical protein DIW61_15220 [Candidatus Aminicenantes bacterium]|nr:hypothetical protein [Candidatus Aminicenantes bacterium]
MAIRKGKMLGLAFLGAFALIIIVYLLFIFPWMLEWGATEAESAMPLPGDEIVPDPSYRSTRAVTIGAPIEDIWPWIAQLGQDRGGFYSYSWIENMMLADIHNARTINPEWQNRREGELLPLTGPNYPLGLIKRKEKSVGPHVSRFEPNQAMILDGWGSFLLRPLEGGKTRFIVRDPTKPRPFPTMVFWSLLFEPGHFTMEREMMKGIKARAEGTSGPGSVWQSLATTGFILTALSGGFFVVFIRRKWAWLAVPFIYAATTLIATADPQAALVGFTVSTLIIAGCLYFRRWWWAYLLSMFVYINVALLLPWDAYAAFGLIFLVAVLYLSLRLVMKKELLSSIKSREEARRKSRG